MELRLSWFKGPCSFKESLYFYAANIDKAHAFVVSVDPHAVLDEPQEPSGTQRDHQAFERSGAPAEAVDTAGPAG
jgi:hypothetical protein